MSTISRAFVALLCLLIITGRGASAQTSPGSRVAGTVKDSAGAPVVDTLVTLLNSRQSVVALTKTDQQGRFEFSGVVTGTYQLLVTSNKGFAPRRLAVKSPPLDQLPIELRLGVGPVSEEVTVAADIGVVQATDQTSQQVNVINERRLTERATTVLAEAAKEEAGLHLQRTSPTIGAIFVRGLTGAKVAIFIDSVRFSTSTARGGINTFFNLNEASNLSGIEVLRGPNSAQFGSDSLGGGIQLISRTPLYTPDHLEVHGQINTSFNSADLSFGGNTLVTLGSRSFAGLINLDVRRANTIRPGGGIDTHAAVTRFLGLLSTVFGDRMTDSAFTQYGGMFRFSVRINPTNQITAHYQRGQQDGGKRYDQTLGGDGNLIADLRNLMLDFTYLRYEKFQAGWFDTVAFSGSFNSQREERVNQGGNGSPTAGVVHQFERTNVSGIQGQAVKTWGRSNSFAFGGEYYFDKVNAPAFTVSPVTSAVSISRGRVPDETTYHNGGFYTQIALSVIPSRLRLIGALRYSRVSYRSQADNSPIVNGSPLWPDDSLKVGSVTPRFGAVVSLLPGINVSGQISRGFRAPHITDLATLGLTGNGFEAAAADLQGRGATIGSTAGSTAISSSLPVQQLAPETSWNYDGGIHVRRRHIDIDISGFVNDIYDNIAIQSLILPSGAVGQKIGDQTILSQLNNGVVFVAASTNPVLVRANFGDARIYGIEQRSEWRMKSTWTFGNTFTWLRAEDRRTGLPPNIEGGTPAMQGWLRLRYEPARSRFWIEPYVYAADRQSRLSTLDLEDRRTGALRSRTNIRNFFLNGATVRGLVGPGTDGRLGTADDILRATNETVVQVQDRVLGIGVQSAPLRPYIPGFVTLNMRVGVRLGERHTVTADLQNLADRNYRGISWGIDAPGRSFGFRYSYQF